MRRYLQLLRQRDFLLLWGGATISALGRGSTAEPERVGSGEARA